MPARYVVPVILSGPPAARAQWHRESGDRVCEKWVSRTVIDRAAVEKCTPDEIEAWDESLGRRTKMDRPVSLAASSRRGGVPAMVSALQYSG